MISNHDTNFQEYERRAHLNSQNVHNIGVIQAGKFELRGAEFAFDYDAFKLDVRQAESLRILVEIDGEFDAYGQKMRWMASTIEEITGTLEIDHPNQSKNGPFLKKCGPKTLSNLKSSIKCQWKF